MQWSERATSFVREGYRTFVGKHGEAFVGVITLYGEALSGEVHWAGKTYELHTEQGQLFITPQTLNEGSEHCGVVETKVPPKKNRRVRRALQLTEGEKSQAYIFTDEVERHFRLALAVDYSYFIREFHSKKEEVRAWWAAVEAGFNEVYARDLGYRFTVVKDDRLIIDSKAKELFDGARTTIHLIHQGNTAALNKLIGREAYDIGGVHTHASNENVASGIATLGASMRKPKRAICGRTRMCIRSCTRRDTSLAQNTRSPQGVSLRIKQSLHGVPPQ